MMPTTGVQQAALAAAATSGAAAGVAQAVDLTVYWLGVPMPVVLAAFMGSCVALSFLGSLGRFRAMGVVSGCTLIGTYLQPLLGHVLSIPSSIWPALAFATGLLAHLVGTALFSSVPGAVKDALSAAVDRIRGRA